MISEIFGPTFQGEGPSLGRRAGFVRLANCNLTCTWCDTPYSWDWRGKIGDPFDPATELSKISPVDVLETILRMNVPLVVVTGGEPLLQRDQLPILIDALLEERISVEVETNGTQMPLALPSVRYNVSPKLENSGMPRDKTLVSTALRAFVVQRNACFKFVVSELAELDEVAGVVNAHHINENDVWIMPEGKDPDAVLSRGKLLADAVLDRGWNFTTRFQVLLWPASRGR